jgi:hypothetical protein
VRVNFGRNTGTSDVPDAAPNRCPRALTLRAVEPRLCSAKIDIVHHNQHVFKSIQNAVLLGGGRSIGVATEARRPFLSDGCGKHASVSLSHHHRVTHLRLLGTESESAYLLFCRKTSHNGRKEYVRDDHQSGFLFILHIYSCFTLILAGAFCENTPRRLRAMGKWHGVKTAYNVV